MNNSDNKQYRKKYEEDFYLDFGGFGGCADDSISIVTTLITIVLIYILGVDAIKEFALPLIVGVIAGAYTSIFLASSFWAVWKEAELKARLEKRAAK